jgi:hypothetical protein
LASETDKVKLNTYLQQIHRFNKRQANAAIAEADDIIAGAKNAVAITSSG